MQEQGATVFQLTSSVSNLLYQFFLSGEREREGHGPVMRQQPICLLHGCTQKDQPWGKHALRNVAG